MGLGEGGEATLLVPPLYTPANGGRIVPRRPATRTTLSPSAGPPAIPLGPLATWPSEATHESPCSSGNFRARCAARSHVRRRRVRAELDRRREPSDPQRPRRRSLVRAQRP